MKSKNKFYTNNLLKTLIIHGLENNFTLQMPKTVIAGLHKTAVPLHYQKKVNTEVMWLLWNVARMIALRVTFLLTK